MKKIQMKILVSTFAFTLFALNAFGDSGADALLKTVGPGSSPVQVKPSVAAPAKKEAATDFVPDEVKLTDPFLVEFYSAFMNQGPNLSLEVKTWVRKIAKGEFEAAAHLWSAMQGKIPGSLMNHARAAQAYLLYRLDLPQSFVQFWVEQIQNPDFIQSTIAKTVETTIADLGFDTWFYKANVQLDPSEAVAIRKLDPKRSSMTLTLIAHTWARKGMDAAPMLDVLPALHPYRSQLARTVGFAYAKKGDLANAARIMKRDIEPELDAKKDPKLLAPYYLEIARFLYQAGAMDGAAQYYQKIPNGLPEYLTAQEELVWIWLREGKTDFLRGSLVTLSSNLFANRFAPEVELVRAISNLKLCYYSEVEKDFTSFLERNRKFAKEIDVALSAAEPPSPWKPDAYSDWSKSALESRQAELGRMKVLEDRSISAVLPAVGPQSHWTNHHRLLVKGVEDAKKALHAEYRRQWKMSRNALQEGIRKMQFVKVELLSELALAQTANPSSDSGDQVASSQSSTLLVQPTKLNVEKDQQTYIFEGVVWSDELFKLRSVARGKCLGQ